MRCRETPVGYVTSLLLFILLLISLTQGPPTLPRTLSTGNSSWLPQRGFPSKFMQVVFQEPDLVMFCCQSITSCYIFPLDFFSLSLRQSFCDTRYVDQVGFNFTEIPLPPKRWD